MPQSSRRAPRVARARRPRQQCQARARSALAVYPGFVPKARIYPPSSSAYSNQRAAGRATSPALPRREPLRGASCAAGARAPPSRLAPELAPRVGYENEAALSRAFWRIVGASPGPGAARFASRRQTRLRSVARGPRFEHFASAVQHVGKLVEAELEAGTRAPRAQIYRASTQPTAEGRCASRQHRQKQVPRLEHAVASGQEGPYRGESCPGPPHRIPCRACGAPWFLRWGYSRLIPCRVVLLALMRPTQSSSGCRSGPRRRPSPRLQRLVGRRPPRLPQRFASSPRCSTHPRRPNRQALECGQRRAGSFWKSAWLRSSTCSGAR